MSKSFSRRRFLRTALAASVLPIFPDAARGAPPAPKRLVAGTRMLVTGVMTEFRYQGIVI
jgi:hypothetical protein